MDEVHHGAAHVTLPSSVGDAVGDDGTHLWRSEQRIQRLQLEVHVNELVRR
jgi:hypothetical protein